MREKQMMQMIAEDLCDPERDYKEWLGLIHCAAVHHYYTAGKARLDILFGGAE